MKKFVLFFVLLCAVAAQNVQAQYVTIPDVNFRNALKVQYPSCFNASNQLDTVCAGNVADTVLNAGNRQIANLEGLKYFKKLRRLFCGTNQLISLPALPSSLTYLTCTSNQLTSLPSTLPSGLIYIDCRLNQLSNLPTLPSSLTYLDCSNNNLTSLPSLPNGLKTLSCGMNQLASIPTIPSGLQSLFCQSNPLTSFPVLPSGLKNLSCSQIPMAVFPTILPSGLVFFSCGHPQLTSLPALPSGLKQLSCGFSSLTSLPNPLPSGLKELSCSSNKLTSLPILPNGLTLLYCNSNPQLSCLPLLPLGLTTLDVSNTNITCLPNKPNGIANNPLPLCSPINNTNNCPDAIARISGYVFIDENNNGTMNGNEVPRDGIKVRIPSKGYYAYTNSDGYYEIGVDSVKTYTVAITLPNYFTTLQTSQSVTFTAQGQNIERNFPLQATQVVKDFKVELTNIMAFARPGFPLHFRVKYENVGTIAGNATVKFAHSALYNIDSSSVAHSFSGDTLVWNFSNVPAGFTGYINVYGRLSASAVLGSTQNFYSSVNQNDVSDNVLADNRSDLALEVRGSYDPNDKQGTRTLTPTQVTNGEFIDYTVRFQNTGTDTAFTVVIADTLANNLQANTLEMVATSHNVRTSLRGNIIYFEYLNILLPDSNVNEPRSHGFVKFRVKPKNTLVLGNTIQNKAAIYFDYNAPVITNTVTTTIAIPTGIAEKISNRLEVFPNPLEGEMLTIPNMRGASAKLLTLTGQELRNWTNIAEQISLQNVAAGMYLLEVSQNGQRRTAKVVVK